MYLFVSIHACASGRVRNTCVCASECLVGVCTCLCSSVHVWSGRGRHMCVCVSEYLERVCLFISVHAFMN